VCPDLICGTSQHRKRSESMQKPILWVPLGREGGCTRRGERKLCGGMGGVNARSGVGIEPSCDTAGECNRSVDWSRATVLKKERVERDGVS